MGEARVGRLMNAIDCASRPPAPPLADKPVALISATVGPAGGAGAQHDARKVPGLLGAFLLPRPEVLIGAAQDRFEGSGHGVDEAGRKLPGQQMIAFRDWILRIRMIPRPV